ncbi:MAG: hypothetical protein KAJ49_04575 [Arcobacteraceae bacterium]|nr:hypothetical protein [Arcobacteraceae bacterium]
MELKSILAKDPKDKYREIISNFKKDWILHNLVEKAVFLTGAFAILYGVYYLVRSLLF